MKLKQEIINKVNNPASRARMGLVLGCGDQMLYIHLKENKDNGRLTKMDALQAIAKEAQIEIDEILEEDKVCTE